MYKFDRNHQFKLSDFNQPIGLKMNQENRWVKKAATIPWNEIEEKYATLFPSKKGMLAKPLRTALGAFIIQKQYEYSDWELAEQIREDPYYQFFIGLPGYQNGEPFVPSLLVESRKRLTDDNFGDVNEMIIAYNTSDDDSPTGGSGGNGESDDTRAENKGTLILDATCAPQQIAFLRNIDFLNETREDLESLIDDICSKFDHHKPRMYRQKARKEYLSLAKCRKHTAKKIRKAIKKQIQYVKRDLDHIDLLLAQDDVYLKPDPALGRPKQMTSEEKKQSYTDNTDRIEVEQGSSLAKRCYGLGFLQTKLDMTTCSSIALSIIAMNVNRLTGIILRCMVILIFFKV